MYIDPLGMQEAASGEANGLRRPGDFIGESLTELASGIFSWGYITVIFGLYWGSTGVDMFPYWFHKVPIY